MMTAAWVEQRSLIQNPSFQNKSKAVSLLFLFIDNRVKMLNSSSLLAVIFLHANAAEWDVDLWGTSLEQLHFMLFYTSTPQH